MGSTSVIEACPVCGARMERGERYRLSVSTEELHTSAHMDYLAFGGSRSTLLCRECAAAVGMLLGRIREEAMRRDR